MQAITEALKSRGTFALLLIIGSTVLAAMSKMSISIWEEYTLGIFGIFTGAKTLTSVTEMITGRSANAGTSTSTSNESSTPTMAVEPLPAPEAPKRRRTQTHDVAK